MAKQRLEIVAAILTAAIRVVDEPGRRALSKPKFLVLKNAFSLVGGFFGTGAWLHWNRIEQLECALLDWIWLGHDRERGRLCGGLHRAAGVAHDRGEFFEQGAEAVRRGAVA